MYLLSKMRPLEAHIQDAVYAAATSISLICILPRLPASTDARARRLGRAAPCAGGDARGQGAAARATSGALGARLKRLLACECRARLLRRQRGARGARCRQARHRSAHELRGGAGGALRT